MLGADDSPSTSALSENVNYQSLTERVCIVPISVGSAVPSSSDSTWYLSTHIDGVSVQFLVDSVANPNLLSVEVFQELSDEVRAQLEPVQTKLLAANDRQIETFGQVTLQFESQGQAFCEKFVVADLGPLQGILGMRFLRNVNAFMGFREGVLCCSESRLQLESCESSPVFHVKLVSPVTIAAEHGVVVKAVVDSGLFNFPIGSWLVVLECHGGLTEKDGVAVPRSVVSVLFEDGNHVVELAVSNFSQQEQVLEAGDVVARLEPIESSQLVQQCSQVAVGEPEMELPQHLAELSKAAPTHLSAEQQQQVDKLLIRFASTFSGPDGQLGYTDLVTHSIDTQGATPIRCRYRPPGHAMWKVVDENLDKMLEMGVIEPTVSPWCSPTVLVRKKGGSIRFCVDLRRVNAVTRKDTYPLPNIGDCLGSLAGSEWFCTLDLAAGYWQVAMSPQDVEKTAFPTHRGQFAFRRMPFWFDQRSSNIHASHGIGSQGIRLGTMSRVPR